VKITDALLGEHGAFSAQFDRIEQEVPAMRTAAEVREQAALLAAALVSHARLEDTLLFDRLAAAGGDPGLMQQMFEEHERIGGLLERSQGTADVAQARARLLEAVSLAREHFAREEHLAFPTAERVLGAAALAELGATWADRRAVHLARLEPTG